MRYSVSRAPFYLLNGTSGRAASAAISSGRHVSESISKYTLPHHQFPKSVKEEASFAPRSGFDPLRTRAVGSSTGCMDQHSGEDGDCVGGGA